MNDPKISSAKDVRKLRGEFRKQYNKFAKDFNEMSIRFRDITKDADLILGATEEIIKYGNPKQ